MSSHTRIPKSKLAHQCNVSNKFRYRDKREAVDYLHRIQNQRSASELQGLTTTHLEKRTYKCNGCQGWHLTKQD